MQNDNIEFEIDRELMIGDAYGFFATLVCSRETLSLIENGNGKMADTYKGHPIIIDNNLKVKEFKVLRKGEKYEE